jgi:hypothetical protein
MSGKFFGHASAKDHLLLRVVQDMQADHAGIQVAVVVVHHRKRRSLSIYEMPMETKSTKRVKELAG